MLVQTCVGATWPLKLTGFALEKKNLNCLPRMSAEPRKHVLYFGSGERPYRGLRLWVRVFGDKDVRREAFRVCHRGHTHGLLMLGRTREVESIPLPPPLASVPSPICPPRVHPASDGELTTSQETLVHFRRAKSTVLAFSF